MVMEEDEDCYLQCVVSMVLGLRMMVMIMTSWSGVIMDVNWSAINHGIGDELKVMGMMNWDDSHYGDREEEVKYYLRLLIIIVDEDGDDMMMVMN